MADIINFEKFKKTRVIEKVQGPMDTTYRAAMIVVGFAVVILSIVAIWGKA